MNAPCSITEGGLDTPGVQELLRAHLEELGHLSPQDGKHALDVTELTRPDVTFWSAWIGDDVAGFGALRELRPDHGELKSMRTAKRYLRRGVARQLLAHMVSVAEARGYARVSLETGSGPAFDPAFALYTREGFERCGPFGDYKDNGFSVFMTRGLCS